MIIRERSKKVKDKLEVIDMSSLADQIERYLRELLKEYKGKVEIQRNQLANDFNCVPSQINYVIDTRFTVEKGYLVESQRGGGGYIRIIRIKMNNIKEDIQKLICKLEGPLTQREAEGIIERLYENKFIQKREKELMKIAMERKIIGVTLPYRDYIRGRILQGMLEVILKYDREG